MAESVDIPQTERMTKAVYSVALNYGLGSEYPFLPREVAWMGEGAKRLGDLEDLQVYMSTDHTEVELGLMNEMLKSLHAKGMPVNEIKKHFKVAASDSTDSEVKSYPSSLDRRYAHLPVRFNALGNKSAIRSAYSIVVGENGFALVPMLARESPADYLSFKPLGRDEVDDDKMKSMMQEAFPNGQAFIVETSYDPTSLVWEERIESPSGLRQLIKKHEDEARSTLEIMAYEVELLEKSRRK